MFRMCTTHRQDVATLTFQPVDPASDAGCNEEQLECHISVELHGPKNPTVQNAANNADPPGMHIVSGGQPDGNRVCQTRGDFSIRHCPSLETIINPRISSLPLRSGA